MQDCEWAFAPFMQMERDFLRDIIFRLFLSDCHTVTLMTGGKGISTGGTHVCRLMLFSTVGRPRASQ